MRKIQIRFWEKKNALSGGSNSTTGTRRWAISVCGNGYMGMGQAAEQVVQILPGLGIWTRDFQRFLLHPIHPVVLLLSPLL